MWVNVEDVVMFGERRAIATIDRAMFINAGLPADLRLFSQIPEFNEQLVRRVLSQKYEGVHDWQLHVVAYRFESDSLDVYASSPQFEEVPPGALIPRI